jgi:hypothetical protein
VQKRQHKSLSSNVVTHRLCQSSLVNLCLGDVALGLCCAAAAGIATNWLIQQRRLEEEKLNLDLEVGRPLTSAVWQYVFCSDHGKGHNACHI